MKKYKATWKLYSARRKITLESLIKQQKISDYESYVTYCENLSIEPIILKDFESQTDHLLCGLKSVNLVQKVADPSVLVSSQQSIHVAHVASESLDLSKNKKKFQKLEKSLSSESSVVQTEVVDNNKEN